MMSTAKERNVGSGNATIDTAIVTYFDAIDAAKAAYLKSIAGQPSQATVNAANATLAAAIDAANLARLATFKSQGA